MSVAFLLAMLLAVLLVEWRLGQIVRSLDHVARKVAQLNGTVDSILGELDGTGAEAREQEEAEIAEFLKRD